MRFKKTRISHNNFDMLNDSENIDTPSEDISSFINDPRNALRNFIQNLRLIVGEQQGAQGVIVLLGVDEQTGQLSWGIAKHQVKRQEGNLSRYIDRITSAISTYEIQQAQISTKYQETIERAEKNRLYYSFWKRSQQPVTLNLLSKKLTQFLNNPREGKMRSISNDTAQTWQCNDYVELASEQQIGTEQQMEAYLMQVQ